MECLEYSIDDTFLIVCNILECSRKGVANAFLINPRGEWVFGVFIFSVYLFVSLLVCLQFVITLKGMNLSDIYSLCSA